MALKIGSFTEAMSFWNAVREKPESGDREGRGGQSRDQGPKKDDAEAQKTEPASPESVYAAVQAFESDPQAQASGLHARLEGSGPGLRVTLTDGNGAVLRSLSGDEFIRLQQATAIGPGKDTARGRGKILDQKL